MGPFPKSHKFEYILIAVDYVSKWAEAHALPTNDARLVITFLKKLFCHFEMPKALISDRGTHFCNKIMEKTMKKYGVNHRFSTSYHPQPSGQVENTNRALKRILEKTVKDNPAIWSRKLDDALWVFCIAYKTPTDTLLQPLFDECFCPPPCVDHPVPEVVAPVPIISTGSPSSTSVDQDAPSPSTSQTPQESPSHVIPLGAKEEDHDIEVAHMDNNP
ncbi:reverse transcriptase domain-containing protein [Tanacetum coccineum]